MPGVGNPISSAAIFGASGGIGGALCERLAEQGVAKIYAGSRSAVDWPDSRFIPFHLDLAQESDIARAAAIMAEDPPQLVVVATGVLSLPEGDGPERSYKSVDGSAMLEVLAYNAVGPALIAKHMLPLFPRNRRAVFAALTARVGSIGDNRLGGWHSYRASKAALNMLIRTLAIELGRTHLQAIAVGLHPGTVDTPLSAPFQGNLQPGQLRTTEQSARDLLAVIAGLSTEHSGKVFDWRGQEITP